MRRRSVACVIGTRPEAIKMAPVIRAFQQAPWAEVRTIFTAQHRDLVEPMLEFFGIRADADLDVMRPNQDLAGLTSRLLLGLSEEFQRHPPDIVLAQGDTTTVLASALASFYRKIPFAHVEAGLRTGDLRAPFPEEANRVLAGHLADLHFAPTESSKANLLREGIDPSKIAVTGNTVIDALLYAVERNVPIGVELDPRSRLILVTAHRRDSFGAPIRAICRAVGRLIDEFDDIEILWPVHPNPAVKPVVEAELAARPRVKLCAPLSYGPFVTAMKRSFLILTDSGGVQEEAPALGKPVLVMRHESERPEAIAANVAKLVGPDEERIVREASRLLRDPEAYRTMSAGASPYGDGQAASRIVELTAKRPWGD